MAGTIFDNLSEEVQEAGNEAFENLVNGISPHELATTTIEEAYKIGFTHAVNLIEEGDIEVGSAV